MYAEAPSNYKKAQAQHSSSSAVVEEPQILRTEPQQLTSKPTNKQRTTAKRADYSDLAAKTQEREVNDIFYQLAQLRMNTGEAEQTVNGAFTCEDTKLLETILEHILLHWEDICECLVDEIIKEEVEELNAIEMRRNGTKPVKDSGKLHNFKNVDLNDIQALFEDYNRVEQRVRNNLD